MNEMERDYLIARAFVAGFVDEAVKLFLAVLMIFIVLWIVGSPHVLANHADRRDRGTFRWT